MDFEGKTAVITGGTGGLGKTVTQAFLMAGGSALVTYRREDELEELRHRLGAALSARMVARVTDVTQEAAVAAMMETALSRFGKVDILLNIVGAYSGGTPVWETPLSTWDAQMNVNLKSAFLCSRAALPGMVERGFGRIISVSSKGALDILKGTAAYAVSKAGVIALTQAIAKETKDSGVTANAVVPSVIDTPENRRWMPSADFSKWVPPEEIARVMLFLASEESAIINGAAIPVYGRA